MHSSVDQLFMGCLLGGCAFSVLMAVSAGTLSRFLRLPRLPVLPRLRLPRLFPRLRLPKLRLVRLRWMTRPAPVASATGAATAPIVRQLTPLPPGTAPVFIGLLATFFGAIGVFCRSGFHLPGPPSLAIAGAGAVATTLAAVLVFWRYFLAGEQVSEVRGAPIHGTVGHVSVAIPADGIGAIAFFADGKRVTLPARSDKGTELPQQTSVIVLEMKGHTAVVERLSIRTEHLAQSRQKEVV